MDDCPLKAVVSVSRCVLDKAAHRRVIIYHTPDFNSADILTLECAEAARNRIGTHTDVRLGLD